MSELPAPKEQHHKRVLLAATLVAITGLTILNYRSDWHEGRVRGREDYRTRKFTAGVENIRNPHDLVYVLAYVSAQRGAERETLNSLYESTLQNKPETKST